MKDSLYKSIGLHIVVAIILLIDLPIFFWNEKTDMTQVPIIVDLNQVKIAEMTNLPPKAKFGAEDQKPTTTKKKAEEKFTENTPGEKVKEDKPEEKTKPKEIEKIEEAPKDETPTPVKQDFMVAPQPKKPQAPKAKEDPKPAAKPEPKKPDAGKKGDGKPELANPLKSLLNSVDSMEKELGSKDGDATIKEGTNVNNMGIEGGIGGSYFSELTISEIDAIAGRLRACWNLDPGAMGAQNMIVEIRAFLNKDGSVRDVKILDTSRYGSDTHFRSVADSARRAVYICAPYTVFSERYADKYEMWNTMLIRFNPLDGSIK